MPKAKMTVYLVIDHGGEWEDSWSAPYMAFASEQAAKECAEKRCKRKPLGLDEYPECFLDEYICSTVCAVDVLVDELAGEISPHATRHCGAEVLDD